MLDAAAPQLATLNPPGKHIIDVLIEERAPRLSGTTFWPVLRPALYAILNYRKARYMADEIKPMAGYPALDFISDMLSLTVETAGIENVPKTGPFLALCNHPTGITDGLAVYDVMRRLRPDVMFYANSDAHRVCARFDDALIPVEWVLAKRTRERTRVTLKMTGEAMEAGRPIVIFPAGRLARIRNEKLTDPEWLATAVSLARRYEIPTIPIHVSGPHSFWFHTFDKFSNELRDITLFHELLNKKGQTYRLTFGAPIPHDALQGEPNVATRRVKHYIERVLGADANAQFDPNGPECDWRDPATANNFERGDR